MVINRKIQTIILSIWNYTKQKNNDKQLLHKVSSYTNAACCLRGHSATGTGTGKDSLWHVMLWRETGAHTQLVREFSLCKTREHSSLSASSAMPQTSLQQVSTPTVIISWLVPPISSRATGANWRYPPTCCATMSTTMSRYLAGTWSRRWASSATSLLVEPLSGLPTFQIRYRCYQRTVPRRCWFRWRICKRWPPFLPLFWARRMCLSMAMARWLFRKLYNPSSLTSLNRTTLG